jgi:hypothetical protein
MNNFWKFIVFTGLFFQLSFAHSANQNATLSFPKENNTQLNKESLNSYSFLQPSVDRGIPNLKQNNRIPVSINPCPTELQPLSIFKDNTSKTVVSEQDIDRCNNVSILLFPFHYHW